ncbi:phosphotyrosine protein [Punctularia strigosozonata HHB-11173 SS5]|uniref:phosphotyrosine protein n=1 Tax=Punctularia strigosozonata (strain HHB-11173) TaxID=741275 RepID=UPI0004417629|nr:phosphotyrosine protein [Punctularia strigosozonata HHB-11173 SS5]EIN12287.1 phosphotyrosine protein [Punctularia strigosozonata HHB-11173 SS5]
MIRFDNLPPDVMQSMSRITRLCFLVGGITTNAPGALYLGSLSAITDLDNLRAHRIGLLVQVLDVPWLPEEPSKVLHIQTHRLPILDIPSADLKPHLETTCAIIERALAEGRNVLVHCQQGVSRSSAIVIAYLICKHGMTYEQAFEFCKARRACVKPNSGFVACLKEWEKQWRPRPPANIRRQTTH